MELERFIDEERERRGSQRITQQVVDRQGIDLATVAAERVQSGILRYLEFQQRCRSPSLYG